MQTIRKSLGLVLIMFVLCGFIFPLTVTSAWTSIISRTSKRQFSETRWQSNWFKAHWTTMDRT